MIDRSAESHKVVNRKVVRIDNLMYKGCEPHWKCTVCGICVPFHCYKKEEFENMECLGKQIIKDSVEVTKCGERKEGGYE